MKAVTFLLGQRTYGIEMEVVTEVVPLPEITSIGEKISLYCGMINYRGALIPVVDLLTRIGEKRKGFELINAVMIINFEHRLIGLIVDKVESMIEFSAKEIIAKPEVVEGMNLEFISQVGVYEGKVIFLMDIKQVMGIK